MELKFIKWEDYNKRSKHYKNAVWFSFYNDFATNKNFFGQTNDEKLCSVFLLCEASKENANGSFHIDLDHFSDLTKLKTSVIRSCIDKLISKQVLEVLGQATVLAGQETVPTEQTNRTNKQNRTGQDTTEQEAQDSELSSPDGNGYPIELVDLNVIWTSRGVTREAVRAIAEAYPDPAFVIQETKKAQAWEATNPKKRKINFARFLNNWLARSWDSRKHEPQQNYGRGKQVQRPASERTESIDAVISKIIKEVANVE